MTDSKAEMYIREIMKSLHDIELNKGRAVATNEIILVSSDVHELLLKHSREQVKMMGHEPATGDNVVDMLRINGHPILEDPRLSEGSFTFQSIDPTRDNPIEDECSNCGKDPLKVLMLKLIKDEIEADMLELYQEYLRGNL